MARRIHTELLAASNSLTVFTKGGRLYLNGEPTPVHKVLTVALDDTTQLVAAATSDKQVIILDVKAGLKAPKEIARHLIRKRPTSLAFSPTRETILVSDAFGDVHNLPTNGIEKKPPLDPENDSQCILGHFSTITHLCMTASHIITCDRDGRIRISCWPLCFVIHAFCLGHSDVVTVVCAVTDTRFVSGSVDSTVCLWNVDGVRLSVLDLCVGLVADRVRPPASGDKGVVSDSGVGIVVADVVSSQAFADMVFFVVHGCACVFSVSGVSGDGFGEVGLVASYEDAITGIAVDGDGVLTVSVRGRDGLLRGGLERWDDGSFHMGEMDVVYESAGEDRGVEGGDEKDAGGDRPGDGRFDWLMRQRKKEMVEDWKGKKRRHLEM